MRQPIIISACLAGLRTRYDGRAFPHPHLDHLAAGWTLVPVCPEVLGGLGIPRPQCRFMGGDGVEVLEGRARILDRTGRDRTSHFVRGAEEVNRVVQLVTPRLIVFKEGSPSCGVRRVDIEGTRQPGCGVTVALLRRHGFSILTEEDPVEAYDGTST
ncbi:MAG: DUF523 domain-containing protein [Desulfomonilaceae bacterium]|nr:DUF523 domain-containing protein [Desulfomonilaceae bacterium]